ncbi:MAG: hypothetical protein L3J59_00605 [Methylococcaceae bacterium]|nr:hypothetical protein [Methylococcaceae bacterium]
MKNLSNKNQKLFDDIYAKPPDAKREIDGLADEIASSVNGKVTKAPIKPKDRAIEKIINDNAGLTGEIQVNTPEMIYAKEPESMARVLIGDDAYNAISSKTNVPEGQGHKFYVQWRQLPDK